ncbi:hypothetical protein B0H13DRAFT_2018390 [Mycena leptocephala]|nr:hypothetical protein B0H13DRAFT_2018390 [Mycena leptocephala]
MDRLRFDAVAVVPLVLLGVSRAKMLAMILGCCGNRREGSATSDAWVHSMRHVQRRSAQMPKADAERDGRRGGGRHGGCVRRVIVDTTEARGARSRAGITHAYSALIWTGSTWRAGGWSLRVGQRRGGRSVVGWTGESVCCRACANVCPTKRCHRDGDGVMGRQTEAVWIGRGAQARCRRQSSGTGTLH